MSDWPKDEDGVVFFRTRQVAEAAAGQVQCSEARAWGEGECPREGRQILRRGLHRPRLVRRPLEGRRGYGSSISSAMACKRAAISMRSCVLGREFGEPPTVRGLLAKNFAEVSHRASRRHCPRRATFRLSTSSHWSTVAIVRRVPRPD